MNKANMAAIGRWFNSLFGKSDKINDTDLIKLVTKDNKVARVCGLLKSGQIQAHRKVFWPKYRKGKVPIELGFVASTGSAEMLDVFRHYCDFASMLTEYKETPLHINVSVQCMDLRNIDRLIDSGVDINAREKENNSTALHIACRDDKYHILEFLLRHNPDILKDICGKNPQDLCKDKDCKALIKKHLISLENSLNCSNYSSNDSNTKAVFKADSHTSRLKISRSRGENVVEFDAARVSHGLQDIRNTETAKFKNASHSNENGNFARLSEGVHRNDNGTDDSPGEHQGNANGDVETFIGDNPERTHIEQRSDSVSVAATVDFEHEDGAIRGIEQTKQQHSDSIPDSEEIGFEHHGEAGTGSVRLKTVYNGYVTGSTVKTREDEPTKKELYEKFVCDASGNVPPFVHGLWMDEENDRVYIYVDYDCMGSTERFLSQYQDIPRNIFEIVEEEPPELFHKEHNTDNSFNTVDLKNEIGPGSPIFAFSKSVLSSLDYVNPEEYFIRNEKAIPIWKIGLQMRDKTSHKPYIITTLHSMLQLKIEFQGGVFTSDDYCYCTKYEKDSTTCVPILSSSAVGYYGVHNTINSKSCGVDILAIKAEGEFFKHRHGFDITDLKHTEYRLTDIGSDSNDLIGQTVMKVGCTTGSTIGVVSNQQRALVINKQVMRDIITVESPNGTSTPFAERGDCGSLVVTMDTERKEACALGMVFAGTKTFKTVRGREQVPGGAAYIVKLDNCLEAVKKKFGLDLNLCTEEPEETKHSTKATDEEDLTSAIGSQSEELLDLSCQAFVNVVEDVELTSTLGSISDEQLDNSYHAYVKSTEDTELTSTSGYSSEELLDGVYHGVTRDTEDRLATVERSGIDKRRYWQNQSFSHHDKCNCTYCRRRSKVQSFENPGTTSKEHDHYANDEKSKQQPQPKYSIQDVTTNEYSLHQPVNKSVKSYKSSFPKFSKSISEGIHLQILHTYIDNQDSAAEPNLETNQQEFVPNVFSKSFYIKNNWLNCSTDQTLSNTKPLIKDNSKWMPFERKYDSLPLFTSSNTFSTETLCTVRSVSTSSFFSILSGQFKGLTGTQSAKNLPSRPPPSAPEKAKSTFQLSI